MPLPDFQIKLSSSFDAAAGKIVKFFCFAGGDYETEKHTHDHELYMRKCDADLLRLLISIFYGQIKKYVENKEVRNSNAPEALTMLQRCMNGFSANGDTSDMLKPYEPYSQQLLYLSSSLLYMALVELNPEAIPEAPHTLTRMYKQLLTLASTAEKRYEQVTYTDIVER